jgi:hypothetical protein
VSSAEHRADIMLIVKGGALLHQMISYWLVLCVVFGLAVGLAG